MNHINSNHRYLALLATDASAPATAGNASGGARRRIWQIAQCMHCSILGTCLTMNDLYVIARRARLQFDRKATAYQVHSTFVDYMPTQNELSKLVDKTLEKRHGGVAHAIRRARTQEELEAKWKEVAAGGQIASAYWGAMSHPLCTKELEWRLFGEVHMLSHLMGASRQSDLCRLQDLQMTCASLDGRLAQLKHDHRAVLKDYKTLEDALDSRQHELALSERRLQSAQERISVLDSRTCGSELAARIEALEGQLQQAQTRASAAETVQSALRRRLGEAQAAAQLAVTHVAELRAENQALEAELAATMRCSPTAESGHDPSRERCGLHGKRILCVGGLRSLVQYYRELVERRGGEFMHHDGGLEDSLDAVTRALASVDVVLCPVDCVSHAACLKVKRACKHLDKPFVPLRSSGLSSFARSIRAIAG